ncbi:MAG: serine/threonine-protein kinase [Rubripirellula sp.]|nr:serine/threonine-protein kinase [Rubripirellula sp.]
MAASNEHELKRLVSELAIRAWAEGGATDPLVQEKLIDSNPRISEQLRLEFKRLGLIERAFHDDPLQSTENSPEAQSAANSKNGNLPFDWTWKCLSCEITLRDESTKRRSSSDVRTCPKCGRELVRTQESATSVSGDRIGHYRLDRVVGAGGFGTVWLAFDEELRRPVALKVPKRGHLDPRDRRTFLREAQLAASVRHPMVVTVYDVGVHQNQVYICSEYIDGPTLEQRLPRKEDQPEASCRLLLQLCEPLKALHEAGIIHRDLKPSNILIDPNGVGRLTDFGIAKSIESQTVNTLTGQVLGTPSYMAPELVDGNSKHADPRTDIYSIGVIFYEMLCTSVPFKGPWSELKSAILHDRPPTLQSFDPPWDIPEDLERVCLKCLEKNPKDRYPSVDLLAADLKRFLSGLPVHAKPKSLPLYIYRQIEKHPALSSAIALATVFFVIVPSLLGTIHGITQDFRQERQSLLGRNRELKDANNEAEVAIAELELQTEHVDRQAAIESLVREAELLADTLPQTALKMAIDVAGRVSADDSPYLPEDQIRRESQAYQLLVDLAVRTVGVQPAMPGGEATQLQLMNPNRLLIRNKITDHQNKSRFNRNQPRVDECFSVWLPNRVIQPPNNQVGKLREINFLDVHPRDRFLANRSAIVRFKHENQSPSNMGSAAGNDPDGGERQLENYSVASPGATTCYWKGLPAADCVVSNDGEIVISLHVDGSVSAKFRENDSVISTTYADIDIEGGPDRAVDQIKWLDDANTLLVEAAGDITVFQLQRRPKRWILKAQAIWDANLDDVVCCRTTIGVHNKAARELMLFDARDIEASERKVKPYLELPCDQVFDLWLPHSGGEIYVAGNRNGRHQWQKWNIDDGTSAQVLAWETDQAFPQLIAHPTLDLAVLVGQNLWLLDASTGSLHTLVDREKPLPKLSPSSVSWLGTTRNLLIGHGTQLSLLDTVEPSEAFQSAKTIYRQPSSVESVVSSPKGDWIASLDRAGNTRIAGFPIRSTLQRTMVSPSVPDQNQSIKRLTQNASGNLFLCHYTSGMVEVLENKFIGGQQSWEKLFSNVFIHDAGIGNQTLSLLGQHRQLIAYSGNTFERSFFHARVPEDIRRVWVSQDDRWLIAWGATQVLTYDLSKPKETPRVYQAQHAIRSLRLSIDRRAIVILDDHPQFTVLDLASHDVINQYSFDADQPAALKIPLIITNDYAFAISGGSIHCVATSPPDRSELNIAGDRVTREAVRQTSLRFSSRQAPSISSWVSKTGEGLFLIPKANSLNAFLVGDEPWQQVDLWRGTDFARQVQQWKLTQQQQLVACSPDRNWILVASGSDAWLWHLDNGIEYEPKQLPIDFNSNVTAAAFSSDGRFLALGFDSGHVRFWPLSADVKTRAEVTIPISTDPIEKLIFLNAGEGLVVGCHSGVFQLSLGVASFAKQLDDLVSQSQRVRSGMVRKLQSTDR